MLLVLSTAFSFIGMVFACSGGGSDQYTFIKTPTFNMQISPPISWTFFPPKPSDASNTVAWFFVGQSNTSTQANLYAQAEIQACMLEAMIQANLPVQGVTITESYVPVQVENPAALTTGVAPLYGKVEAGALTMTAVPVTGATAFVWMPFSTPVQVNVQNSIGATLYTWNIVKNTFMEKLMLSFGARFASDIAVTGSSTAEWLPLTRDRLLPWLQQRLIPQE